MKQKNPSTSPSMLSILIYFQSLIQSEASDSQLAARNSKLATRNSQLAARNSQLAARNSQLAK
jgi:hypothetical protein